jgi:hypothetical protein
MTELSPIAIKRLRNEGNNIRKLSREILDQEVWPFALCINVIFIFNYLFRGSKSILTKQNQTNGRSGCSILIKIQKFIKTYNHS